MIIGKVYTITLGGRFADYLCTGESPVGFDFKRVQLPTSKMDALTLPENIRISRPRPAIKTKKKHDG